MLVKLMDMQVHIVSITSQGQMTVPVSIRRALGLDKNRQIRVQLQGNTMVAKPIVDFLDLEGIYSDRAIKGKTTDEIIKIEEESVAEAVAERYKKKLKRMTDEPHIY